MFPNVISTPLEAILVIPLLLIYFTGFTIYAFIAALFGVQVGSPI